MKFLGSEPAPPPVENWAGRLKSLALEKREARLALLHEWYDDIPPPAWALIEQIYRMEAESRALWSEELGVWQWRAARFFFLHTGTHAETVSPEADRGMSKQGEIIDFAEAMRRRIHQP